MRQAMMFSKRGTSSAEVTAAIAAEVANRLRYPDWVTGNWYDVRGYLGGTPSTAALNANSLRSSPIWVPRAGTLVDRIGFTVSGAGAAGTKARLMLHLPTAAGLPGALILDAGEVAIDSTGDKEITISQALPAGIIYASVVSDGAPTLSCITSNGMMAIFGTSTAGASNLFGGANRSFTYGVAPDPWGASPSYSTNTFWRIALRAA